MSVDDKLNFLIHEMGTVKQLTQQVQQQQGQISQLSEITESMQTEIVQINHTMSQQQFRIIDLEARSRRNNLLFFNIAEAEQESDTDCERALLDFFATQLKLSEDQLSRVVFQRVHRLGRPRRGVAPNGQPWKSRPVIAGFRDFKCKQDILFSASELKGTQFAIREDFPAEIRSARGKLWDEFKSAKSQNLRARIVYPAKLVVDGWVVRDMFPEWGQWAVGGYVDNQERGTQIPRSGTPIDIPIGDLIGRIPFQQAPCPRNLAQHPMQTPPAGMLQAPQHPPPVPLHPPPAPLNPAPASSPAPLHAPPTPMHPPPLPLHPPPNAVGPHMAADGTNNADTTLLEIAEGTTASSAAGTETTEGEPPLIPSTMPDRRSHVTSGHTALNSAATIGVSVVAHRHNPNVNNAPMGERAPEPPPRRHRDGGGVAVTTQQPMHNGSPTTVSTSGSTSGPTSNGTASYQAGQVMHSLPNAVGNALATVLENA